MKVGLGLFLSSAAFSIAIAAVYWFVAHDPIGTFLLGFMAFAMLFVAGYTIVSEREARLLGDRPDAKISEGAGERVGVYAVRSALPPWLALAIAVAALGLLISPPLFVLGVLGFFALMIFMVMQSA